MNYDDLSVHGLTLESYQERIEDLKNALQQIINLANETTPKRTNSLEGWDEYRINRIKSISQRALQN